MQINDPDSKRKPAAAALVSVFSGRVCIGHVMHRGPAGFESFSASEESLGLYRDERAAIAVLMEHPEAMP